jgi:hypothetical protein
MQHRKYDIQPLRQCTILLRQLGVCAQLNRPCLARSLLVLLRAGGTRRNLKPSGIARQEKVGIARAHPSPILGNPHRDYLKPLSVNCLQNRSRGEQRNLVLSRPPTKQYANP